MNKLAAHQIVALQQLNVAVLFGGVSAEREISLRSGHAVVNALQASDMQVTAIDFDQQGLSKLLALKPDVVFNILHGAGGEDGQVQGILEYLNIPYSGSGIKASALTMDKLLTKKILLADGISTPDFLQLDNLDDCTLVEKKLGFPVMIKPVYEGSSIGMSLVTCADELAAAYQLASQYGEVMAETWIKGKEYTAAFLGDDLLPLIELQTDHQFYDYDAKYESDDTRYICPCDVDEALQQHINVLVKQTIKSCEVTGWGRVDLMCDDNNKPYVIEVNTTPGMTDHSLVPMAAKQAGLDFQHLVLNILHNTMNKEVKH